MVNLTNTPKPSPLQVSIVPVKGKVYGSGHLWHWNLTA